MSARRIRVFPEFRDGRDQIVVHAEQDYSDILKVNHETMMANGVGRTSVWQGREYVKVASVPLAWLDQLWAQGIKYSDPEAWKAIKARLNSNEFEKFRTAPGRF